MQDATTARDNIQTALKERRDFSSNLRYYQISEARSIELMLFLRSRYFKTPHIRVVENLNLKDTLNTLMKNSKSNESTDYYFIVLTGRHATALQVKVGMAESKAIIIDAVDNEAQESIAYILGELNIKAFTLEQRDNNAIQKSGFGCLIFSIYHVLELQKNDFFNFVSESDAIECDICLGVSTIRKIDINKCPPQIVLPCQSTQLWNEYKKKNSKIDFSTYDKYRQEMHLESAKLLSSLKGNCNIIPALAHEYINPALKYIRNCSDKQVLDLVNNNQFSRYHLKVAHSSVDTITIDTFKNIYMLRYSDSIFKNPCSEMKSRLSKGNIKMEEVLSYAETNPNTRTASIVSSMNFHA